MMKIILLSVLAMPLISTAATVTLTGSGMVSTTDPFPGFTRNGSTEESVWGTPPPNTLVVAPLPGAPAGATLLTRTITAVTFDISGQVTIAGRNVFPAPINVVIPSGLVSSVDDGMTPSSLQQNTTNGTTPVSVAVGAGYSFTRNYAHTHIVPPSLLPASSTGTSFTIPTVGGAFFVAVNGQDSQILNSSLYKVSYEYSESWQTVPEPSRALSLMIGALALVTNRRRPTKL